MCMCVCLVFNSVLLFVLALLLLVLAACNLSNIVLRWPFGKFLIVLYIFIDLYLLFANKRVHKHNCVLYF